MSLSKIVIQNEGDKEQVRINEYTRDIHIVRNGLYFDFSNLLFYVDDQGELYNKSNVGAAFPDLQRAVTTNLKQTGITPVNGVYSYTNSAIEVDTVNLKLRALPLTNANTKGLSAFFLLITCKESSTAQDSFSAVLRIFVHDKLLDFWLTPATLTLRPVLESNRQYRYSKLTVYALFSGNYYADITDLHGLQATSSIPQVLVNAYDAQTHPDMVYQNILYPADENESAFPATAVDYPNAISLTLPDMLKATTAVTNNGVTVYQIDTSNATNNKTVQAGIKLAKWGNGSSIPVKHITGPVDRSQDTTNVLFVSEGFTNETDFENFLTTMLNGIKTTNAIPYNFLCSDQNPSVNFYSLFIPSSEDSASLGEAYFEIYDRSNVYENYQNALLVERTHTTGSSPYTTVQKELYGEYMETVGKLMQLLGYANTEIVPSALMTSAYMEVPDAQNAGQSYYNTLSGLVDITDMDAFKDAFHDIFSDMTVTPTQFRNACRAWASTTKGVILFNETDTTFGIIAGERPSMSNLHNRYVQEGFSYRRYRSKTFIGNVFNSLSYNGAGINYFSTEGKDTKNVVFVTRCAEASGTNAGSRGFFLNVTTSTFSEIQSVKLGNQYTIKPISVPGNMRRYQSNALSVLHTFAHEFTHSYNVLDEYDRSRGGWSFNTGSDDSIDTSPNNTTVFSLLKDSDNTKVDFDKLKWNRYVYAAVIKGKYISSNQFQILDNEIDNITTGDTIVITSLEAQQIMADNSIEKYTDLITISSGNVDSGNKKLTVSLPAPGSTNYLRNFEADKIYYVLKLFKKDSGPFIKFMAPAITAKLTERNGSITMKEAGVLADFKDIANRDVSNTGDETLVTNNVIFSVVQKVEEANLPIDKLNTIAGLGKKEMSNIVGLYVGGDEYKRNVYHATGRCMMRASIEGGNAPLPLCPICSYHVLLSIDYTKVKNYFNDFLVKNENLAGADRTIRSLGKYFLVELNSIS